MGHILLRDCIMLPEQYSRESMFSVKRPDFTALYRGKNIQSISPCYLLTTGSNIHLHFPITIYKTENLVSLSLIESSKSSKKVFLFSTIP